LSVDDHGTLIDLLAILARYLRNRDGTPTAIALAIEIDAARVDLIEHDADDRRTRWLEAHAVPS